MSFFSVVPEMLPLLAFFRDKGIFAFFCHEGIIIYVAFMHIYRKLYFHVFFNKDHLLSRRKNLIISGKKKYHLSRYYIKDHIQVRIFWRDNLFRTHEENTFPGKFLRRIIFPFVSKE